MNTYSKIVSKYLNQCKYQKQLNQKTICAYQTDLEQLGSFVFPLKVTEITSSVLENYLKTLHRIYKPRTAKRKIASAKAFFQYLEFQEIILFNPWSRVQSKFREPSTLPKLIPLYNIEKLLSTIYGQIKNGQTAYRRRNAIRDAAICELLFATGLRVFELCSLTPQDVDLNKDSVFIHGKGSKERILHIGNAQVHSALTIYRDAYTQEITLCKHFFANQNGHPFSDQSVRRMLNYYTELSGIRQHITPHMWRHTFATSLLEADVDIRYIQEMLGHSSIHTTEIYTHVSMSKQREILRMKHPRNMLEIG